MSALLFALELPGTEQVTEMVIRALAVAGAAALGFFGMGGLTQLLARAMTTRSMPKVPLNIIRMLGAVAFGLLAWALLFRGGGSGSGGGGGLWPFGGDGATGKSGESAASQREAPTNRADTNRADPDERTGLRIVVVGSNPVVYRVAGVEGSRDLDKLKEFLLDRKKATPPLQKLDVVVYKEDGPVPDGAPVTALTAWARDNGLKAAVSQEPGRTP